MGKSGKWQESEFLSPMALIPIQLREGANSTADRLGPRSDLGPHPGGLRQLCVLRQFAQKCWLEAQGRAGRSLDNVLNSQVFQRY
jgi:hypothetical protein